MPPPLPDSTDLPFVLQFSSPIKLTLQAMEYGMTMAWLSTEMGPLVGAAVAPLLGAAVGGMLVGAVTQAPTGPKVHHANGSNGFIINGL